MNYIALSGALAAMRRKGEAAPVPLNLVGDFGEGWMFLAFGIMAALWERERERSGKGQVMDAAIVDGIGSSTALFARLATSGRISLDRGHHLLGGAAPFYRNYLCCDGGEMSVGPSKPKFFGEMLFRLDLSEYANAQGAPERWDDFGDALERTFLAQDRTHWEALFDGSDACVWPVLTLEETMANPHHVARDVYIGHEGTAVYPGTPLLTDAGSHPCERPGARDDCALGRNIRESIAPHYFYHRNLPLPLRRTVTAYFFAQIKNSFKGGVKDVASYG